LQLQDLSPTLCLLTGIATISSVRHGSRLEGRG